jgi:chemotaxis-related protein WspD
VSALPIEGCWKAIGIYGDASCVELVQHIHCRNCPVHASAAAQLLDAEAPALYTQGWTQHVAAEKPAAPAKTLSVVVFRIAAEWLALPSAIFKEIAGDRLIHSLPHRRNGALLGVVNIRGELLVCTSLMHILGIDAAAAAGGVRRMLVIQQNNERTVCPVDEVHGIERFQLQEFKQVPAMLSGAAVAYTKSVLFWKRRSVGVLDTDLLFQTLNRSCQSATST